MKLSIIIPVYNVENYIEDCLNSCVNQDLPKEEYEIICVDDGSHDNSAHIIEKYSNKYNNIKLIRKSNGGVSSARNLGLDNAIGDYVWFVDGDDALKINSFKKIIEAMYSFNLEALTFSFVSFVNIEEVCTYDKNLSINISEYKPERFYSYAWRNIVSRKLLIDNRIVFDTNLSHGEDLLWICKVENTKPKAMLIQTPIYYHRKTPNSLSDLKHKNIDQIKNYHTNMVSFIFEMNTISAADKKKKQRTVAELLRNHILFIVNISASIKDFSKYISDLRKKQLYPNCFQLKILKPRRNLMRTLRNWLTFFFPIYPYLFIYFSISLLFRRKSQ